jgi:hypothetical protein
MTVNSLTFASDIILFIRDYLKENIVDPLSRDDGFVMTSYPKRAAQYPMITCKHTNMTTKKLGISSEINSITLNLEIRIWSRNAKQCDQLTQDVINALRLAQFGTDGTSNNNIFGFKLNSVNSVVENEGDNTIHSKVCSFVYMNILT